MFKQFASVWLELKNIIQMDKSLIQAPAKKMNYYKTILTTRRYFANYDLFPSGNPAVTISEP